MKNSILWIVGVLLVMGAELESLADALDPLRKLNERILRIPEEVKAQQSLPEPAEPDQTPVEPNFSDATTGSTYVAPPATLTSYCVSNPTDPQRHACYADKMARSSSGDQKKIWENRRDAWMLRHKALTSDLSPNEKQKLAGYRADSKKICDKNPGQYQGCTASSPSSPRAPEPPAPAEPTTPAAAPAKCEYESAGISTQIFAQNPANQEANCNAQEFKRYCIQAVRCKGSFMNVDETNQTGIQMVACPAINDHTCPDFETCLKQGTEMDDKEPKHKVFKNPSNRFELNAPAEESEAPKNPYEVKGAA